MARSKKPRAKCNTRRAPTRALPSDTIVPSAPVEAPEPCDQPSFAVTDNRPATERQKALAGFRAPSSAPPEIVALADRALVRVVDVLEERVQKDFAGHVLKAAQTIRDEICGPVPKTLAITGLSLQDLVRAAAAKEAEEA